LAKLTIRERRERVEVVEEFEDEEESEEDEENEGDSEAVKELKVRLSPLPLLLPPVLICPSRFRLVVSLSRPSFVKLAKSPAPPPLAVVVQE
jgi:hypothetical protein